MGVILSCVSDCISLFFKSKKISETSFPLIEVTVQKKDVENADANNYESKISSNLEIKKNSVKSNEENNKDHKNYQFFTPRQSLKNKNVKFSIVFEDKNLKDNNEKMRNKSFHSNKSLDFFSCKESDSKRESLYIDEIKILVKNQLVFNISLLKNFSQYQTFIRKLKMENLELINISKELSFQLNMQCEINYEVISSEISDYSQIKSYEPLYSNSSYECKIFLGSELSFDNNRTFLIKGEFFLNCQAEDFLFFINNEEVFKDLMNFEAQLLLGKENDNSSIYFANVANIYGNIGCNFIFHKRFFHENMDIWEISFSLTQEEIIDIIKTDKMFDNFQIFEIGQIISGISIKQDNSEENCGIIHEKPKIKILMYYKINYKQNLSISVAKFMYANQIKLFFEKIKKVFPVLEIKKG